MTMYLHIGSPKSGSSALQAFLLRNRDLLRERGFEYPPHWTDQNMIASGNGQPLAHAVKTGDDKRAAELAQELLDHEGDLIVSSEYFYHLREDAIAKVAGLLGDFTVIVYFRRQVDWIMAAYSQMIKRRGITDPIDQWLEDMNLDRYLFFPMFRYSNAVDAGNVVLRLYDKESFHGGNIFADFLHVLDLELTDDFWLPKTRVNSTYPRHLLEFKRVLNAMKIPDNPFDWVLQSISDQNLLGLDWPHDLLSPQQKEEIELASSDHNAKVARTFLGREDGRLFPPRKMVADEQWQAFPGLTEEDVRQIADVLARTSPDSGYVLRKSLQSGLSSTDASVRMAAEQLAPALDVASVKKAAPSKTKRVKAKLKAALAKLRRVFNGLGVRITP